MKYSCKHCGQRIEADASWEGREVGCPGCSASITLGPESVAAVPAPAAGRRWLGLTAVMLALAAAGATAAVFGFKRAGGSTAVPQRKPVAKKQPVSYEAQIRPLLGKYCYDCHGDEKQKADLNLQTFKSVADVAKDPKTWEHVLIQIQTHEMPPPKKAQPTPEESKLLATWIEHELFHIDCDNPDPGRVTIRRLNRAEYNNTIRDLTGVDFKPANDFPTDDSGYGFDNIGDVLSMPPIMLEKYLNAARGVADAVIATEPQPPASVTKTGRMLGTTGDKATFTFDAAADGDYRLIIRAGQDKAGTENAKMAIGLNGAQLKEVEVRRPENRAEKFEETLKLSKGPNTVTATFLNNLLVAANGKEPKQDRNIHLTSIELIGPIYEGTPPPSDAQKRFFLGQSLPVDASQSKKQELAAKVLAEFARKAFRRPVKAEEVKRLVSLVSLAKDEPKYPFEKGIKLAMQAVLVSPHFLFRGEVQPEPDNPKSVHFVNEFALASRLSYFLWSSMPDERLFRLAEKKQLRKNLDAEIVRMLKDDKARSLVDNFAGQWLQLRSMPLVSPDVKAYPAFDEALRNAMIQETEMFFQYIAKEDRPVTELLTADYTFVNERLARHYGITNVVGPEFQKVSLAGTGRRGILTHGSVLTLTSNPTRTSPVKRGKWVLENILATPPPPAPPDVPTLEERERQLTGSLRQRMVQHREDPTCNSCHARMDPIGFGFEHFDGIGAFRSKDGQFAVESADELATGEKFTNAAELIDILVAKKSDDFLRCAAEKALVYALGRGLEPFDKCTIEDVTETLKSGGYKFSTLVSAVVKSVPFQQRRGEMVRTASVEVSTPAAAKTP